ncbi:tripartite tricarboxylate transporter TctB family protein [Marinomonas epiphytica]
MFLNKNLLFYYFLIALSFGYLITAIRLGAPVVDNRPEPSFFPIIVGALACIFSLILITRKFQSIKQEMPTESRLDKQVQESSENKAPLLIMGAIFLYIIAFSYIGYFISSYLFVLSVILIFSSMTKVIQKAMISLIIVFLGYLIFEQVFGVRLPALWE